MRSAYWKPVRSDRVAGPGCRQLEGLLYSTFYVHPDLYGSPDFDRTARTPNRRHRVGADASRHSYADCERFFAGRFADTLDERSLFILNKTAGLEFSDVRFSRWFLDLRTVYRIVTRGFPEIYFLVVRFPPISQNRSSMSIP